MIPYSHGTLLSNRLSNAYFRANWAHIQAGRGKLHKGQFMQEAYPSQHYKNEASARRQFNKVTSLRSGRGYETTGVKIEKRGRVPLLGGGEQGLWLCLVHYKYIDANGFEGQLVPCKEHVCIDDQHMEVRSFTLTSMQYDRLEDKPYIEAILPAAISAKVDEWKANYDTVIYDVASVLRPAGRSDLPRARQFDLDSVEIE